ncbi:GOLPH3/VPS74 family protein [Streptomyces phaeoluteigriseus]|uniref:GOLPH3/VPS74 family protein n=1 Tax=Streptomyces phaeoluteigriseus TaxID=114686 RepID=UPI00367CFF4A
MTTAQDLMIVSLDVAPARPVEQGELSLALAGAELIDLVEAGVVVLDGDRVTPGQAAAPDDRLLADAASSLVRREPYESVEEWLWRRGRGLMSAYTARMEADGVLTHPRGRWLAARSDRSEAVDSPARSRAAERWASAEPVLAGLATTAGLREEPGDGFPGPLTDPVATVLAAVGEAVTELTAAQQRRSVEDSAFDNVWRGL